MRYIHLDNGMKINHLGKELTKATDRAVCSGELAGLAAKQGAGDMEESKQTQGYGSAGDREVIKIMLRVVCVC